ncbi:MAG: hypothetical protein IJO22_09100 [Oscillospiraceae bacterium]|nr:hypothetical protein [Oscillospiraceae bacterium]
MNKKQTGCGIFLAVLAAALYAINAPFSKLLLDSVPPTMMAGLLYLWACYRFYDFYSLCFAQLP